MNSELVMTAKELFPVTPGSLLLALSKESFTFQASDFVGGKVTMTVIQIRAEFDQEQSQSDIALNTMTWVEF